MARDNEYQTNNTMSVVAGMLIGGLAGAIAMLLLAPQSGRDTRMQLQEKGIELRDRTTGMMDDAVAQVRSTTNKFSTEGMQKAKELKQQGQDILVEQLDRASHAVKNA